LLLIVGVLALSFSPYWVEKLAKFFEFGTPSMAVIALAIAEAVPVRVEAKVALTVVEVLASMVLRSAAETEPAATVTATSDHVSIVEALIAVAITEALPVSKSTSTAFTLTVVMS
jgi:hypothetical protein